jgi:GntR family transcriptional regulator
MIEKTNGKEGRAFQLDIVITNSSPEPIYEQIVRQIKKEILTGELQEGEALPSIRSLARELQISVITTKRAYEELEREGLLETVGGKGSFVAGQNKELWREKRLSILEEKLAEVIKEARLLQISRRELEEMLEVLCEEE